MTEQTAPRRILAGPFNRVEGDLEIRLDIDGDAVRAAYVNSPLFRGFERILEGKDPRDALTIVPRICGICSVSQSVAAARALGAAAGISPPINGERVTSLLHAVENMADHLTHFYLFFMADFARQAYSGRAWHDEISRLFQAKTGVAVRQAVDARAQLLTIMGLLAGKWPHTLSIQPGGVTKAPDARDRVRCLAIMRAFRHWLEANLFGASLEAFIALDSRQALEAWTAGHIGLFLRISEDLDLGRLGPGAPRFMSYGAYEIAGTHLFKAGLNVDGVEGILDTRRIVEDLSHSWMLGQTSHPFDGSTIPDEAMRNEAYSWCKAPRYDGQTVEVGAFARQLIDGHPLASALLHNGCANVRARVVGRALELALSVVACERWIRDIEVTSDFISPAQIPDFAQVTGLCEAARGSLGHWLTIRDGRIAGYQIVAPTTWNFSPRDGHGVPGALEMALVGARVTDGEQTPLSVQHIVRSFDPCMVCTVH
ncbi:nickel-dependent hydrogenase large subunit [Asticcacaulis sp. 201]|uniref:nickel-dependent hydrogenase large subunit n=1 Tax=Asticcacaulis sp. 201 TaxID=3028787 RepID=UPI002916965E|nr:nickel-dependent hydrogenase large subunit [Asticcacaulis sp. 201]MDV6330622.1 nickel-dependent hydrogenase large subunit [Asticcacaulis sp. 201]